MVRAAALTFLLLAGCDQLQSKSGDGAKDIFMAEQAIEIERLKGEVSRLKDENAQQDRLAAKAYDQLTALQSQVNNNAKIANEGAKIADERWAWVTKHVHQ